MRLEGLSLVFVNQKVFVVQLVRAALASNQVFLRQKRRDFKFYQELIIFYFRIVSFLIVVDWQSIWVVIKKQINIKENSCQN